MEGFTDNITPDVSPVVPMPEVAVSPVAPIPEVAVAPVAPTSPVTPVQYPGSSFTIQCPNSGAPTITVGNPSFQNSMNSFGSVGSGTADGISGNPGSTPSSGIKSSTPAATKKDNTPTSVTKDDDTDYKPTLEKCKEYYTFDPKVDT